MSRGLARRRPRVGDALHLGDELVAMEDPDPMEFLERENALPRGSIAASSHRHGALEVHVHS
jgi:hypothetical protein